MESQLKGWTARSGLIALAVSVMVLGQSIVGKE
jgi:hypothetical protein